MYCYIELRYSLTNKVFGKKGHEKSGMSTTIHIVDPTNLQLRGGLIDGLFHGWSPKFHFITPTSLNFFSVMKNPSILPSIVKATKQVFVKKVIQLC